MFVCGADSCQARTESISSGPSRCGSIPPGDKSRRGDPARVRSGYRWLKGSPGVFACDQEWPARRAPSKLDSELVVGRGTGDLAIDDPGISRRHALFRPREGFLEVEDLGSSNGTRVNGERISTATRLRPGDVVEVGATAIEVHVEPARTRIEAHDDRASLSAMASASEPSADVDELRPVTALFADVVGSTTIGERLEPEEVKALIGECVSRMARAVEQFGGVVDAFMGDGIAAFFGLPMAHEDDAVRAARAALQIVQVVGEYARDIETAWGLTDFNVRVGLNSGQVAVGLVGGNKPSVRRPRRHDERRRATPGCRLAGLDRGRGGHGAAACGSFPPRAARRGRGKGARRACRPLASGPTEEAHRAPYSDRARRPQCRAHTPRSRARRPTLRARADAPPARERRHRQDAASERAATARRRLRDLARRKLRLLRR